MYTKPICICVILLLSAMSSAQAVTVMTAVGNGADTYLSNDAQSGNYGPDSLHGSDSSLAVRRYDGTRQKLAYVRFDLSIITGGNLNSATLSFNVTSSNRTRLWGIYGLINEALDNWNEATISYNNAPGMLAANLGYYAIDESKLQKLGTMNIVNAPAVYTSITTDLSLDAFLTSDTNKLVTFVVIPESTDSTASWSFSAKEAGLALAPTLTLPNAIPEPATTILLGLGGLALIRRKRA